ncbi:MAG: hypothetical protein H7A25_05165 [Leptospiraceae bacterium]|nr:hypothetical protein [Leptospiraceae bacterium]MCP5499269.1 hypothetical protein [Leptospiraceae bacterium]
MDPLAINTDVSRMERTGLPAHQYQEDLIASPKESAVELKHVAPEPIQDVYESQKAREEKHQPRHQVISAEEITNLIHMLVLRTPMEWKGEERLLDIKS